MPGTYRSPTETGFYYLQSRYYDPALGRFLNADSYASTGQGFLGYNMFAYCGNNPVNALDYSGHMMVGFGIGTSELYGGGPLSYGSCAMAMPYSSVSSTGSYGSHITMVPMASTGYSALAKTVAVVGTAALVASSIAPAAYPNKKDEEEKKHQAYFPENPDLFIPFGLVRNDYPTKRNGIIIKWSVPNNPKIVIFEWNEDYEHGSHYHAMLITDFGKHRNDHWYPGEPVPEPWNTMYFGFYEGD